MKDKILKYLKRHPKKEFSIRTIHKLTKISYPTAQRAVAILQAEGKINVKDLGNGKLVSIKKEFERTK